MKLYIVRHGQTIWNWEKRMQGSKNSQLTEKGIEEAKLLHQAIRDIDFDRIYTSPLGRTLETMEYVKGDLDIPISYVEEIQEMDFGLLEGEKIEELEDKYQDLVYNLWNRPEAYENETGENYRELFARVEKGLDLITSQEEENVLVITHGVVISTMFTILKGLDLKDIWKTPVVANTSLSIVEINGQGRAEFLLESDTSHLE